MTNALVESTVPSLFTRQAAQTPDLIAVIDDRVSLSYRDLAQRVVDLAGRLIDAGLGPEDVIAVGMPRSAEMVVTVLASMAAGGAFVPVDPTWPAARREQVISDAGARFVVADVDSVEWPVPILHVDAAEQPTTRADDALRALGELPLADPRPGDGLRLAYVIFTSGSTGKPKGAMIRHEAICERLVWQRDEILDFGSDDATLFKAPLSFDISVNEILLPLVSGGRVVVAAAGEERDPDRLLEIIEAQRVTFVYLVSSMLDVLLEMDRSRAARGRGAMTSLRHVWCGGEVLTPGLFARFRAQTETTLYHGYGPAEATIGVSHVIYRDSAERIATSIGRPNPRTSLYVLDDGLTALGVGEAGELYAAGFLLGRGYCNAGPLTASRFIADPFGPVGSRMYRTGDRARWTADGSLEFLGRVDNQVKLRGRRIELEEIEATVASAVGVRHCAVTVVDTASTQRLVAYVTAADDVSDGWSAEVEVRRSCEQTLPDYMVPETIVVLDAMPTTANGKVDRRALPDPTEQRRAGSATPTTPNEALLCRVFGEVLGLERVAADDDFFSLGGDSIVAIRVISALRREGFTVRVRDVFTARTPMDLASALRPTEGPTSAGVETAGIAEPTPILRWLHDVAAPAGLDRFHQGICLTTPVGLQQATIQAAVDAVAAAHPILGAALESAVDLTVPPTASCPIKVVTVDTADDDSTLAAAADRLADAAAADLDHRAGRVVTAAWIDRPGDTGRLVVVAHHAVVDGISLRILADDVALAVADPRSVAVEPVSWRGWASSLAAAARTGAFDDERDFWVQTCSAPAGRLGMRELDPAVDTVATEANLTVELDVETTRRLVDVLPGAIHGSPHDALVAALVVAVTEHIGVDAVTVEMEGHGRESEAVGDADLSRTVGWFTTLYPVHVDLAGLDRSDRSSLVKHTKEQLRRVPRNGIGYGVLRHLSGAAPAHRAPVLVNYLGRFAASDADWAMAPGTTPYEGRDPRMPLPRPLEVNAVVSDRPDGPRLSAVFSSASGVLRDDAVRAIADRWVTVLSDIAAAEIAGHTASDFPTVRLTAADLAALEAAHPGLTDVRAPTSAQQGIAFHSHSSDTDPYLVQQIVDVHGPVDPDVLARASHSVIATHSALSARFVQIADGSTVVVSGPSPAPEFRVIDASSAPDHDAVVRRAAAEDRARGFDLTSAPLTRYTLVSFGETTHRLVQTVHHIVADGWSVPLVLAELRRAYLQSSGPTVDRHPAAMRALHARDRAAERTAWAAYLDGVFETTSLAEVFDSSTRVDDPGRDSGMPGVGVRSRLVDADVCAALIAHARRHGVTVSSVLHAAWGLTLGIVTGRTDVTFGSVVSGRGPGLADVVGLLVNTVPVRVEWSPDRALGEIVEHSAERAASVVDHPHVALADLHRAAGVGALFDTLVVIENLPDMSREDLSGDDAAPFRFGHVDVVEAPHYPLTVMVSLHETVELTITNRRADLGDGPADDAADLFLAVLSAVVTADDAETAAALLELGADPARGSARVADERSAGEGDTIARRVNDALSELPDVVVSGRVTPGAQVSARVRELRDLLREKGVGPDDRIVVELDRGVELLCVSLAVLAVGATLVPVDPGYPAARIEHMRAASAPTVVVDGHTSVTRVPASQRRTTPVAPGHGAYLLFTSGSTGVPKAVLGTQQALSARLAWQHPDGSDRRGTRLMKSSLSFVDGLTELLAAALCAERIVIADDTEMRDLTALAALVEQWAIDDVTTVPSVAAELCRSCADQVASVRRWTLSAEPLTADVVELVARSGARVENFYGSSEVAGDVTAGEIRAGDTVTVGRPVGGSTVRILDRWLRPVSDGTIGELYVAGPQLARGYHGAPALTASRFVADPAGAPGDRLYRTGDLAARTTGGTIVLHGRADLQFSVRGMRVEAGEVESALLASPGVAAAVVDTAGRSGALVGYVVPVRGAVLETASLLGGLGERLPRHAVPDRIVVLDELPLTPSGKVDRAALPDPSASVSGAARAPANDAERTLAAIIGDVLGRTEVGPDDDFFALGGDSISSVAVVARAIRSGFELTTQDVFRSRTAAGLAAHCAQPVERTPVPPTPVLHQIRTSDLALADLVYTEAGLIGRATDLDQVRTGVDRLAASIDAATMRVIPRNRLIWASDTGGDDAHIALTVLERPGEAFDDVRSAAADRARSGVDISRGDAMAATAVICDDGVGVVLAGHALAVDRVSLHRSLLSIVEATAVDSPAVVDVATAFETARDDDAFGTYRSAARGGGDAELSRVEAALADAAKALLGDDVLIDVETDLRAIPGVGEVAVGPFTPTVPLEHAGPAASRHWHPLAQLHDPDIRKASRRRPSARVLVTRLYGSVDSPEREGAELRYPIVARYRLSDTGAPHLTVLGDDDLVDELARAWRHKFDDTTETSTETVKDRR